jgi:4-diphosphocytidyl-2-C-methyl-D-erythritol kinase
MAVEVVAPAKVNLTLEVLGVRPDGYHEIASLMQTIDLVDRVRLTAAASVHVVVTGEAAGGVPEEMTRNLAYRAAVALSEMAGRRDLGVRIELEKRIPAGGLAGGSSDAAAVLRGLDLLWGLALGVDRLTPIAAGLGSDVVFFLHGGTALARGRGEVVEPLSDLPSRDLTVFVPQADIEDKTRRMYEMLAPDDLSTGRRTLGVAASVRRGVALDETDLINVFDRHIRAVAPTAAGAMLRCREEGIAVVAAGSGPAFFSLGAMPAIGSDLRRELEDRWGVTILGCQTLTREAALAVREA